MIGGVGGVDKFEKRRIEERFRDLEVEGPPSPLKAVSTNKETLRYQINCLRQKINWILNEDMTLAERILTLFQDQDVPIASVLIAIGMRIRTLLLALTDMAGGALTPSYPMGLASKSG